MKKAVILWKYLEKIWFFIRFNHYADQYFRRHELEMNEKKNSLRWKVRKGLCI